MEAARELRQTTKAVAKGDDIQASRKAFAPLSEAMAGAVRHFAETLDRPVIKIHCPMAFNDRGADWLQSSEDVANPYFGAAMYGCGAPVETIVEAGDE